MFRRLLRVKVKIKRGFLPRVGIDMKYICTETAGGEKEIFTFPGSVNHDVMAEAICRLKDNTRGPFTRISRQPISAGFINSDNCCHGESITLRLKSRPDEDTKLLSDSMIYM